MSHVTILDLRTYFGEKSPKQNKKKQELFSTTVVAISQFTFCGFNSKQIFLSHVSSGFFVIHNNERQWRELSSNTFFFFFLQTGGEKSWPASVSWWKTNKQTNKQKNIERWPADGSTWCLLDETKLMNMAALWKFDRYQQLVIDQIGKYDMISIWKSRTSCTCIACMHVHARTHTTKYDYYYLQIVCQLCQM